MNFTYYKRKYLLVLEGHRAYLFYIFCDLLTLSVERNCCCLFLFGCL